MHAQPKSTKARRFSWATAQLALRLDRYRITPLMARIEAHIRRRARNGEAAPANTELLELAGCRSRSSIVKALRRLCLAGRVRIERRKSQRRFVIVGVGRLLATDWGYSRPGHRPYCKSPRPKGPRPARVEPVNVPPPVIRLGRPLRCDDLDLSAPDACQAPKWGDERPGATPVFCGQKTLRNKAWCADCAALLTEPSIHAKRAALRNNIVV